MIDFPIPKKYTITLDDRDKAICTNNVIRYGIEKAIEHQFTYLDCSRVKNGFRLMQTIGVPYTYEMSKLAFILYTYLSNKEDKLKVYFDKLKKLHKANLKYEEENPPIVYDKSKKVKNVRTTRKRVLKEATLEGFEKPKKVTAKSLRTDVRAAILSGIKLTIK